MRPTCSTARGMLHRPHHGASVDRRLMGSEVDRPYASRMAELDMPMLGSDAKRRRPRQHGQNRSQDASENKDTSHDYFSPFLIRFS